MVRGVARLWVTSPKLSINRGERKDARLELVLSPLSIPLYKNTERRNKM